MVYRPKTINCACLSKKVAKRDSSAMQRCVLRFKGRFGRFEAISAVSRPQIIKNVLKMGFFGKTPGVNGLSKLILLSFFSLSMSTLHHLF